jgi:L-methionine (R)-S-oxide reductase
MSAYTGALEAIDRILNRGGDPDDVLRGVVSVLHDRFDHYSWIGIYLVEGEDLVLGPWQGPQATEHVRIPLGQGICGAAAASGQTEIVDDVNAGLL